MAQNVIINGVTYQSVPEVDIPKNGGGTAKFFDTADGDITSSDVLTGKTGFSASGSVSGSMANNGSTSGTISTKAGTVTIPAGYTTGGTVSISSTEQAKVIASNIKSGITILGVEGTYSGEAISVEANKNVTPATTQQVVTPSAGYDYLAQVTVAAIPYSETANTYGTTVTIG